MSGPVTVSADLLQNTPAFDVFFMADGGEAGDIANNTFQGFLGSFHPTIQAGVGALDIYFSKNTEMIIKWGLDDKKIIYWSFSILNCHPFC